MRQPAKWLGFILMLVVICISTGWSAISSEPEDACCKHETTADKGNSEQKSCNNEGNPFQFCSCCIHAWVAPSVVLFEPFAHASSEKFFQHRQETLPWVPASGFWQPPRFS